MSNILHFIRAHVYVILLYIIGVAIVCFLFPREGKFPYEYQKGKIWGHENLYAPFDIPILKTQQELDAERDSLLKTFVTYYNEHSEQADQQKRRLRQIFDEQWEKSELNKNDRV